MINYVDLFILIVIAISVFCSWKKGLIMTLFNFGSGILSIIVAKMLYTPVMAVLKQTVIFDNIKNTVSEKLQLSSVTDGIAQGLQTDFITKLNVPDFFKISILENNNPEIYNLFNVSSFEDYISSYIADFIMSIITIIIIIVISFIIINVIARTLDFISKFPVINFANHIGGAIIGFAFAIIIIWIVFAFLTLLFAKAEYTWLYDMIKSSTIAYKLYENNIILNTILKFIG